MENWNEEESILAPDSSANPGEDDEMAAFEAECARRLHQEHERRSIEEKKAEKKESANVAELTDLKDAAIKHIPVFIQTLGNTSYELQRHETYLCILIKAGFRPSEIAILMNMTPQNISNLRARLNKKMFHTDNGAKDFNEKIINLTSS